MKKVLKIAAYLAAGVLCLALVVGGLTQTDFFRSQLRSAALERLESLLVADVTLGTLSGNLISGFSIDGVSVRMDDRTLLSAERVDLRYDIFQIPGGTIFLDNVTLIRPSIDLWTDAGGRWSLSRMIRPLSGDTAASGPFPWNIVISDLVIQEGTVLVEDSAALGSPEHGPPALIGVEYHHFTVQQLNLQASVLLEPDIKSVNIKSLTFLSERPDVQLLQGRGEFTVTSTKAMVRGMRIQTGRSDIELDASMEEFDLFRGIELYALRNNPADVRLRLHRLDLVELGWFIPQVNFLQGVVRGDVECSGPFGELAVKQLDLRTGNSVLYITGEVFNLHSPSDLVLNAHITESLVSTDDARRVLPSLGIPDFHSLGMATLNVEFDGKPLDFHAKFLFETEAGDMNGETRLIIGGPQSLSYDGTFGTRDLDLGLVFSDPSLTSALTGTIRAAGKGIDVQNMTSAFSIRVDSSRFMNQPVSVSQAEISAREGALQSVLNVRFGKMKLDMVLDLDLRDELASSFRMDGNVASMNIAELVNDPSYDSDITMAIHAEGSALSWEKLTGNFNLGLLSSRYRDYVVDTGNVRIELDQRNRERKSIQIESSLLDASITGLFDLERLGLLVKYQVLNMKDALGEKFAALDSSLATSVPPVTLEELRSEIVRHPSLVDATYFVRLKNLEPVSMVTGNRTFDGEGVLRGAMVGDYKSLSVDGRIAVPEFFYGNADSGILVQKAEASFIITNIRPDHPLDELEVRAVVNAEKMHLNRTQFDSLRVSFTYREGASSYTARTIIDQDLRIGLKGIADVASEEVVFLLNEAEVAYRGFDWTAQGGASIGFGTRGVRVADLVMQRDSQRVVVDGFIGAGGNVNGVVTAGNIALEDLKHLLEENEVENGLQSFSGRADVRLGISGTLERPEYDASVLAKNVAFRTVPFGRVQGSLGYKDLSLGISAVVEREGVRGQGISRPVLNIQGTVPMDLTLAGDAEDPLEVPMNLSIQSDGIQMSILDALLPTFNDLAGVLKCDVRVAGTRGEPVFTGAFSIDSCSFLFVPNNIRYTFEGSFEPKMDRIRVQRAVVRNIPEDKRFGRDGEMEITGDFSLRRLKPGDFNLTTIGKLLVVKETTRRSSLSVYGNLFIETGPAGLHFTGEIERSLLKGYVLVKNSSLIFPPTETTVSRDLARSLRVIHVNDTLTTDQETERASVARYFGSVTPSTAGNGTSLPSKSFLDGLRYELEIESRGGNTEIRMIFNAATGEELVANLDGRFSILEDGTQWIGTVSVDRAYYNFTKRFDAEGTISYSGDFMNPELNVTARYRGTRVLADSAGGDRAESIVVTLKITGSRKEPKLDISMTIDGEDYYSYAGPKSSDVNSDAIQFLITGSFPLTESQKNDIAADIRSTVGSSLVTGATSLLSNTLSEFLRRETGFINSIEIGYGTQGTIGESADIRISGVVGDGLWRIGGKVLGDPFSNANVSLLYSLGDIFRSPTLRNFMFELERRVETTIGPLNDRKEVNSARLFYRLSF